LNAVQNGLASPDKDIRNSALELLFELIHRRHVINLLVKHPKPGEEPEGLDQKTKDLSTAALGVLNNLTVLLFNTIAKSPEDPALGLMVATQAKILERGLAIRSVHAREAGRKLAEVSCE
jgi:hypothetical protein